MPTAAVCLSCVPKTASDDTATSGGFVPILIDLSATTEGHYINIMLTRLTTYNYLQSVNSK